ncbi:MAG: hypothetical protein JNN30_11355 [Rhodanobacteraceae bacterium]|nr:hypothetical protein [Rhodanobacteraceae bacterium]
MKFSRLLVLAALSAPLIAAAAPNATAPKGAAKGSTTFAVSATSFAAWTINNTSNPPLTLERGRTYIFDLTGVSGVHPFNINTTNTTGSASRYNQGVTNNGATGNTDITFVVPANAPSSLHYNCGNHAAMNGSITVIDPDAIFASNFDA